LLFIYSQNEVMKTRLYAPLTFFSLIIILLSVTSCQKEEVATNNTIVIQADALFTAEEEAVLSKYVDTKKFSYIRNVTTAEQYKIFLGRTLFYDTHLSKDESVSCASCHQQQFAFADNVAHSKGASGNTTERNSISLASFGSFSEHYGGEGPIEALVENSFFWDERVGELSDQMMETFANPNEMGMKLPEIGQRVEDLEYAKLLYDKAYKGAPVTTNNVIDAISAFVNRINSADAPFDTGLIETRHQLEEAFPNYDDFKNHGKQLFLDNCASCHAFSLSEEFRSRFGNLETIASNGLDMDYSDQGVAAHTYVTEDNGKFKIPGLRNIQLTAPYMHDGRFATLEEVIEFYNTGIQPHPNLHPVLQDENGEPIKMNFSEQDKNDLVAFLTTLTGRSPMADADLSDPFK